MITRARLRACSPRSAACRLARFALAPPLRLLRWSLLLCRAAAPRPERRPPCASRSAMSLGARRASRRKRLRVLRRASAACRACLKVGGSSRGASPSAPPVAPLQRFGVASYPRSAHSEAALVLQSFGAPSLRSKGSAPRKNSGSILPRRCKTAYHNAAAVKSDISPRSGCTLDSRRLCCDIRRARREQKHAPEVHLYYYLSFIDTLAPKKAQNFKKNALKCRQLKTSVLLWNYANNSRTRRKTCYMNNNITIMLKNQLSNTKIISCGAIIEIRTINRYPQAATIKRLNDKEYICCSTGEVKEYMSNTKKIGNKNIEALNRAMKKLRLLIAANCAAHKQEEMLFITLTYAENMQDTKRLYADFKEYIRRLRRKYSDIEYIYVAEPQARGAWHIHAILYSSGAIYITPEEQHKFWEFGRCRAERLKSAKDIGAYITSYFCFDVNNPRHKKTSRLERYPKNMRFYRTSKGIIKPEENYCYNQQELQEILTEIKISYDKTNSITVKTNNGDITIESRTIQGTSIK